MNGIPLLKNTISFSTTPSLVLGTAEAKLWELLGSFARQWGIYPPDSDNAEPSFAENLEHVALSTPIGNTTIGDMLGVKASGLSPVVQVDSIVSIDSNRQMQICDYRIEQGGFASYNKVTTPELVMINMTRGGTREDRKKFLTWLEDNINKPTLFDIVVPEKIYRNVTLESCEIVREATNGGASLITAQCVFRQVMIAVPVTPSLGNSSTKNAQSANDAPVTFTQRVSKVATDIKDGVVGAFNNTKEAFGRLF